MTKRYPRIGLTGSIGMGKSTVAGFFEQTGFAIWDADRSVHRLYQKDEPGFAAIKTLCPDATTGAHVDREILIKAISNDPDLLPKIEAAIHPLVAQDRAQFWEENAQQITLCDIPLLLENDSQAHFDVVIVVHADPDIQKTRVLERPGMTQTKLDAILARQMPSSEKIKHADFVIRTDIPLEETGARVNHVAEQIKSKAATCVK